MRCEDVLVRVRNEVIKELYGIHGFLVSMRKEINREVLDALRNGDNDDAIAIFYAGMGYMVKGALKRIENLISNIQAINVGGDEDD